MSRIAPRINGVDAEAIERAHGDGEMKMISARAIQYCRVFCVKRLCLLSFGLFFFHFQRR